MTEAGVAATDAVQSVVVRRRETEEQSQQRRVADDSPDLQAITALDGFYRFVSPSSQRFGWNSADLVGQPEEAVVHPDDRAVVVQARGDALDAPGAVVVSIFRLLCADGSYCWVERLSRVADENGERYIVSATRDIGDRKASELDLERRASTDPLTGVANRAVFMDRLEQALKRLDRREGLVAVLYLDLDQFKVVNDSAGHLTGDEVLLQMAARLRAFLRPQDTLARLGGDEFAIVVEDMAWAEEAIALGKRVAHAARTPFVIGDEQFVCTTSVGVAVTEDGQCTPHALLQEADLALYRAKDRGRDRAEVFDEDLRTRAVGRLGTERMLRRAIDEGRLRLHYQPIIDLRTGDTVAAEALVRVWDDEDLVLTAAEAFIQVAEDAGLLPAIDDWVLSEAILQAAAWRERFAETAFADLGINVTARHLADSGFARSLIDELAAHGLPTGALQIEVTERVLMEASNSTMTGLTLLRDAGVKVGLDDFGTGYSSLSYLRVFPLDFVKIDQSFTHEMTPRSPAAAIVKSIVELSHALGMAVVAEGVESQDQLDQLFRLGCDRAQGYLFAAAGGPDLIERRVLGGPAA